MEKEIKVYNCGLNELRTYLFVLLFVAGNIVLPQLCHLIPDGGKMFLPIYFFTLIASYKYGVKVGLMTAVLSPVINSLLFGMPALAVLPAILIKSVVLALAASFVANKTHKVSFVNLLIVILTYQCIGTLAEWAMTSSWHVAVQDFRIGVPGMLLQLFGTYLLLQLKIEN